MPTIQFKGKTFVQNHHLAVPYHQLVPQKDKSLTETVSLHDNLIVHGDNLLALKALLPTYAGKIKCIYIDPPYNTGNENWVYNDNVKSPIIKEWIGQVVGKEGEDLTRHDKWLCMMLPRLKLLKELLAADGVILISSDDNEQHRLRALCDEIFGDQNHIATIIWEGSKKGDAKIVANIHEYITVYAKDKSQVIRKGVWRQAKAGVESILEYYDELRKKHGSNHDEISNKMREWYKSLEKDDVRKKQKHFSYSDDRGLYFPDNFAGPNDGRDSRPRYDIIHPVTNKPVKKPATGWRWEEARTIEAMQEVPSRIHFGKDETTIPNRKSYLSEVSNEPLTSVFYKDGRGASNLVTEIFGKKVFDFPKSHDTLKDWFRAITAPDDIILDSFAGTGSTAHAVLELNQEELSDRKFIMVEMEEYADNITAERVRRVIKGLPSSKDVRLKKGLGGTFSYFSLGDPIEIEGILNGKKLPSYLELARYIYYTATGEEFDESKLDETKDFVGESSQYDVYMLYKPDIEYLKQTALTLNIARELRKKAGSRQLLVFAPTKYVESGELDELKIDFCQLPFEIYKVGK